MSAEPSDDREVRTRAKNRAALIWIVVVCLAIAACGFAYARWLLSQPHIPSAPH